MTKREIQLLVVTAGKLRVGLPAYQVRETMRPLPVEELREPLPFVVGLAVIRGEATPVVDLGEFLTGRSDSRFGRFVTLEVERRTVALAVDEVLAVIALSDESFRALPPLLTRASGEALERLSYLDSQLLLTLEVTKLMPPPIVADEVRAP